MTRLHVAIQLRWSDFDAYAHVNNAEMLRILEEARIQAFWRPDEGGGPATAILDTRPGADTMGLIARQEVEHLAPIPYMRGARPPGRPGCPTPPPPTRGLRPLWRPWCP